jgi:hypothetical protein
VERMDALIHGLLDLASIELDRERFFKSCRT